MPRTSPAHAAPGFLGRRSWPVVAAGLALIGLVGSGLSDHGTARRAVAVEPVPQTQQGFLVPIAAQLSTGGDPTDPTDPASSSARASRPARHTTDPAPVSGLAADGIPTTALAAYRAAAERERTLRPQCGLPWTLLAAIGRIESDHGRFAGAVLHADGLSTPPVVGIPLDGHGTALITDTDGGRLDGDPVYDRAVGPMQFIPSTWAGWGVDGNHDGRRDPFNILDAAPAAADYLCAAGGDLTTMSGQVRAVLSYNHSDAYVAEVLALEKAYATGTPGVTFPTPDTDPRAATPTPRPTLPPVDPAPGHRTSHRAGSSSASSGSGSGSPPSDPPPTSPTSPSTSPGTSGSPCAADPSSSPATSSAPSTGTSSADPSSSAPADCPSASAPSDPTSSPASSTATGSGSSTDASASS